MSLRIQWNEQEEAILLSALIKVLNREIERKRAVTEVSIQLRKIAVEDGIDVDEKFRNENGIALQMSKLEYVFTNGDSGLRVDTGWYFTIVQIYRNEPEKYKRLLKEDTKMPVEKEDRSTSFSAWVKENKPEQATKILSSLNALNAMLLKCKAVHSGLLFITDSDEIESILEKIRSKRGINIHSNNLRKSCIEALSAYKDYLHYMQNKKQPNDSANALQATEQDQKSAERPLSDEDRNQGRTVIFGETKSYSYTRPYDLEYCGSHYSVRNWTQTYVQLAKCLMEDYPNKIASLKGKSLHGKGRIDVADTTGSDAMLAPREIAMDLFLETNESAGSIVEKSTLLTVILMKDRLNRCFAEARIMTAAAHAIMNG